LKSAREGFKLSCIVESRASLLEGLETLAEVFKLVDVGKHRIHLGLEAEPRVENWVLVTDQRVCPRRGAATETADCKGDFEVVGGVRVLHNVEVHFTRDDEGQILGGPAGVLRRDRKFRLFGGEEAALASLETRKLGTKLFVRIGGLLTETSDLVAESLELSIDGIGKSAITEAGELVTEILKFLAGGRGSLLLLFS
jgi:hypothetical protein